MTEFESSNLKIYRIVVKCNNCFKCYIINMVYGKEFNHKDYKCNYCGCNTLEIDNYLTKSII